MLKKVVYAGSNDPAFQRASKDLLVLAEVSVTAKQVERLTERIGRERLEERNAAVTEYMAKTLAQRDDPPAAAVPPQLAVVEMDGGRLQIRSINQESDQTPTANAATPEKPLTASVVSAATAAEPTAATVTPVADVVDTQAMSAEPDSEADKRTRSKHWREDKVGCLLRMKSVVSAVDPCPDIPAVFVDPLRSLKLAQEIGHCAVPRGVPFAKAEPEPEEADKKERRQRPGRPEIVSRRVVASRKNVDAFGPLLAAAAWAMGLFGAKGRAFVCDGLAENWSVQKRYFPRWTGVLDFVHAMTYVYAAAMAGRTFAEGWPVYERWIQGVWAGQVSKVIKELTARQEGLGPASKEDKEGSPRRVVQEALTYLQNQQDKMRYDEYRKQGLPLMSSHVESTVKQINYRMKGTEKFWSEAGAEALLQLRADYLSDDEPMEEFWQRRQAEATGQRPYRRSA